ncbi:MAG: sugar phosphate nucleotidyltransferase [Pirellula sp.]
MKVVLFCGGLGMRLREYSEAIPKPLVSVGNKPILWHIMKYYAHFGHTDFILCLGWKGETIKEYFLNYNECMSNDFVLDGSGNSVKLLSRDIHNWNITFVDTGLMSNIGQRLKAVENHLRGEETFLANYTDGLSDFHLPDIIDFHRKNKATATFMTVRPTQTFHVVEAGKDGSVTDITAVSKTDLRANAGFFVFEQSIFQEILPGEEIIPAPFNRLIAKEKLFCMHYDGFFGCMDTFKEKQMFDDYHARGETPWEVWREAISNPDNESAIQKQLVTR